MSNLGEVDRGESVLSTDGVASWRFLMHHCGRTNVTSTTGRETDATREKVKTSARANNVEIKYVSNIRRVKMEIAVKRYIPTSVPITPVREQDWRPCLCLRDYISAIRWWSAFKRARGSLFGKIAVLFLLRATAEFLSVMCAPKLLDVAVVTFGKAQLLCGVAC